jgi:hypothetical protein
MAARTMLFAAQAHVAALRQRGRISPREEEVLEKVNLQLCGSCYTSV